MTFACEPGATRLTVYGVLIAAAAGIAAARIASAELVIEPSLHRDKSEPRAGKRLWPESRPLEMPTFSSNDRSRWATVRALVEEGTFVVGRRAPGEAGGTNEYGDRGIIFEDGWKSVDKILDPETKNFYSSKPPLLSVVAAGEYWLLHRLFGLSIVKDRWVVIGTILFTLNWLPFLVYLWALSRLIDRYGGSDWGRLFVLAAACFGTLVTPFLITFNNHTLATCTALFSLYPALLIWDSWREGGVSPPDQNHVDEPNAATEVLENVGQPIPGSGCSCGPVPLFIASGFFAGLTASLELPAAAFAAALFLLLAYREPLKTLIYFVPAGLIPVAAFLFTNYLAVGMWSPAYAKFGTVYYEYEGSHWRQEPGVKKAGIDFLEEPKPLYAFNLTLGHHGLFSLTPVFLLSLGGLAYGLRGKYPTSPGLAALARPLPRQLIVLTLFLLAIVVGFYIFKSNNYGGWTAGPRWLMWLTPFLLLTAVPIADKLASCRYGRSLGYLFLALSIFSASYPLNPWRHPWIHVFVSWQGWIDY